MFTTVELNALGALLVIIALLIAIYYAHKSIRKNKSETFRIFQSIIIGTTAGLVLTTLNGVENIFGFVSAIIFCLAGIFYITYRLLLISEEGERK